MGTYRAEAPCAKITLVLRPDHSFLQSVQTQSGRTNQLDGRWFLNSGKIIEFDSFLDFVNDERGINGTGGTGFRAERWPRGIIMGPIIVKCADSSYKLDYVK